MTGFLRRAAVILWAAFGFVGIGVLLGYLWLDRALDRVSGMKPAVQFSEAVGNGHRDCPALPRSADDLTRAVRARPGSDIRTCTEEVFRCAGDDEERRAFLAMLHTASARGNTFASRALETIVRSSCEAITASTGVQGEDASHTVATCVDVTMRSAVRMSDSAEVRRRMLRIAQILTLIEAEVATPEIQREFCAEVEVLPAATYDRLAAVHPAFSTATAQVCQIIPPADDAGVSE